MRYTGKTKTHKVTIDATTPVKLFTTNARGRAGYRAYNPDDTNKVLIIETMKGDPAPAAADFAEILDYAISGNSTIDSGAEDTIDIWALSSSGTILVACSELFSRRDNGG